MVVELTTDFVDVILHNMEEILMKIAKMKKQGRRASLVGAEIDLMRIIDDIVNVMQGCLHNSQNHHEMLMNIFGGDCIRISKCRVVLDYLDGCDEYESARNVQSGRANCEAVERVLIDLGCHHKLQMGVASQRLDFLLNLGTSNEKEIAAASQHLSYLLGTANEEEVAPAMEKPRIVSPGQLDVFDAANLIAGDESSDEEENKREQQTEYSDAAKLISRDKASEDEGHGSTEPAESSDTRRLIPGDESTDEEEMELSEQAEEQLRKQTEEELRKQAEEDAAKHEEALQLEEAKAREQAEQLLQEVGDQGIVEVLQHDTNISHAEPAPGVRVVVIKHDIAAGKRGTLIEPEGIHNWKMRLDDKSEIVVHVDSFETALPPVAAVNLKETIEFEYMFRGQPPSAILSDPDHAAEVLQEAANVLKIYDHVIVSIEGHTATPDDKMDDWAFALAQGRADKVKDSFIDLGIAEHRLKPIGLPGRLGSGVAATLLKIVSM